MDELYPEIVIAGCGNMLFGDDGYGPEVVERLKEYTLPDNVKAVDVGLAGPHFCFNMLDNGVTKKLIIIDIIDFGAEPGTLTKLRVEDLPPGSYRDVHSWALTEPLNILKDTVDISIIGCQPKNVPAPDVEIGISTEVEDAIPLTIQVVLKEIGVNNGNT